MYLNYKEKPMKFFISNMFILTYILSNSYAIAGEKSETHAQLVGTQEDNPNTVKIRTVNKGEILFDEDYNLPSKILVKPGKNELSVMCEFFYEGGSSLVPGHVNIEVKANKKYRLVGTLAEDGMSCTVDYKDE